MKLCILCDRENKVKDDNVCSACRSMYKRFTTKRYFINLMGGKCVQCGCINIHCLEFDHLDPTQKIFCVGTHWSSRTFQELQEEVLKCQLLCSNCHQTKHNTFQRSVIDYFERQMPNKMTRKEKCQYRPQPKFRKVDRPTKEELQKLIWTTPTKEIAKSFGVSDKAIEKWCRCYELEKPPRGYWQKKKSNFPYDLSQYNNPNLS